MSKIKKISNNCVHCAHCVKHYANLYGTFYLVNGCMHRKNRNRPCEKATRELTIKKYAIISNPNSYKLTNDTKILNTS